MRNSAMKKVSLLLIALLILSTACTQSEPADFNYSYDGSLKITGIEDAFEIAYDDIFAMEAVTKTVQSVTSSGEEVVNEVKGVLLNTILQSKGLNQSDLSAVRLIAGDGYEIDVPPEVVAEKDIILAYEFDGEPLAEDKQPLRSAIDGVRTMYFVSQLQEINLSPAGNDEQSATQKVIILETEASDSELHDYTYYESNDQALKVAELFQKYNIAKDSTTKFVAGDGFEKTEKYEVLSGGYFKVTGENVPLFIAPDLPKGMQVKNFITASCGQVVFMSAAQAIANLPTREIDGVSGAKLEEVIKASGLDGDSYLLAASDNYQAEIAQENLEKGILCLDDSGQYKIKFDQSMPKSAGVKNILSIAVGTSGKEASSVVEEPPAAVFDEGLTTNWTITFEGLSDGSFDFTSEKAARKLELIELETTFTKDDQQITDTWEGYRVLDVLNFLKVTDFNGLVMTAGDGYQIEYSRDEIDDKTIFAVVKNGQEMTDESNLVRLVQDTEFASKWLKGVCKVTVK